MDWSSFRSKRRFWGLFSSVAAPYLVFWFVFVVYEGGPGSILLQAVISILVLSALFLNFYLIFVFFRLEIGEESSLDKDKTDEDRTVDLLNKLKHKELELSRLRELDKTKSEFISMAAHQLKTPLSGIKWSLDMLLNDDLGPLNQEQRDLLMKSREGNEHMIFTIDNMLNVGRIESGQTIVNKQFVDLRSLIDDVLYYTVARAQQKNIKIDLEIDKSLSQICIDVEKIRQVFQNLLDNAVKYTMEGGVISLSLRQGDGHIMVSIADSGIGIPADQQNKVFQKFFRSSNVVESRASGTGIGLFVVKSLVEQNGGEVSFQSKEGRGTTFYVKLPLESV